MSSHKASRDDQSAPLQVSARGTKGLRRSGLAPIDDVPWGTHFCQFYETKQDLIDTLVPYFKAGLEDNEFRMWVTAEPLDEREAEAALRKAVPDLDRYLRNGQIDIIPHTQWYLLGGQFDQDRVLKGWVAKLDAALERGFDGLRLTGNTFWLEKADWGGFTDYEAAINAVIGNHRMIALCTYSTERCGVSEVADVISNHEFALIKRAGKWSVVESSEHKRAEEHIEVLSRFPAENPNPVMRASRNGTVLYADEAAQRILDLGGCAGKVLPTELSEAVLAALESGSSLVVDREFGEKTYWFVLAPIVDREYVSLYGQDITERKQAEEALQRQTDRLTAVAENTRAHLVYLDRDFNFIWVNQTYADACARSQEEFIGHNHFEFYPHEENQAIFESVSDTGVPFDIKEKPFVFPDHPEWGVTYWDWTLTPIKDSQGTVESLVFSLVDVTRDVQARQEIERLRVESERRREELYQREHHIAEVLQQALVPPEVSCEIAGIGVAVKYQPAMEEADVGGDFYDIIDLGEGRLGVLIGDVAGKGLPAAMRVAAARYAVRSYALLDSSPASVLTRANRALLRDDTDSDVTGMLTAFFAVFDTSLRTIHYASAGHEPPVLRTRQGRVEELVGNGMPFGVTEDSVYEGRSLKLRPGDMAVMLTDGITEARSSQRKFFGRNGLIDYLSGTSRGSCEEVAAGLLDAALEHAGGSLQDDAAIIVVQITEERGSTTGGNHG